MLETSFRKKLDSRKSDKIAFLVKGSGIQAVKELIQQLAEARKLAELEVVVFYSCKNQERVQFREQLEQLAKENESLKVVYTMTGLTEEESQKWQGETGFIDRKMIKRNLDNEQDYSFFVVGTPTFNQGIQKMLQEQLAIKPEMVAIETVSGHD